MPLLMAETDAAASDSPFGFPLNQPSKGSLQQKHNHVHFPRFVIPDIPCKEFGIGKSLLYHRSAFVFQTGTEPVFSKVKSRSLALGVESLAKCLDTLLLFSQVKGHPCVSTPEAPPPITGDVFMLAVNNKALTQKR